jgi:S1-C subfamily serine protease
VSISGVEQKNNQGRTTFTFHFPPLNYEWQFTGWFTTNDAKKYGPYNFEALSYLTLQRAYPYKKPAYDRNYELHLAKRKTGWTKNLIMNDFKENGLKPVEGIYENSSGMNQAKYNVAVKYMNGTLRLIYLSGADNPTDWDEGEIKATLTSTATPNFYKANWIMANKTEDNDFYVSFKQGMMSVISPDKTEDLYVKMYPTAGDNIGNPQASGSGTGFAIASIGLIATNYHVVENAKTIKVRGINGNFDKLYSAKVLLTDKNNDLAIIKIDDYSFSNLGTIPYVIKSEIASVGADIFVLGYPLRASMGDEIKLTNGIVSAKTGFQGDVTSYQISAPIQPGNSGGPLFNGKGDIVGIINAKHTLAENASYAIKTSYLLNLINLLDTPPALQKTSVLGTKSLSQQVESVKTFVYIIEVN